MENDFKTAKQWLDAADAILISASNGLSIAEGYNIFAHDQAFMTHFAPFAHRYGLTNIIQCVLYPYPDPTERQAFYTALFAYMIDDYAGNPIFQTLKTLITHHDYFVVTSNGDLHFQLNGFAPAKIFEIEGNFKNNQAPAADIHRQQQLFNTFMQRYNDTHLVILELGVGARNQLLKAPLMQLVAQHPTYRYITLNLPSEINIPAAIAAQTIGLAGTIQHSFKEMLKNA